MRWLSGAQLRQDDVAVDGRRGLGRVGQAKSQATGQHHDEPAARCGSRNSPNEAQ